MSLFAMAMMSILIPLPTSGQYFDNYGNELRHRGNGRGSNSLHPPSHVQHYGFGRHSARYRAQYGMDDGGAHRSGQDYHRNIVLVTRVLRVY